MEPTFPFPWLDSHHRPVAPPGLKSINMEFDTLTEHGRYAILKSAHEWGKKNGNGTGIAGQEIRLNINIKKTTDTYPISNYSYTWIDGTLRELFQIEPMKFDTPIALLSGITCRKCNTTLPPHLMSDHLDVKFMENFHKCVN
tara:strand:- start:3124 stop:3549 length:426 start_codon:yes stop_codon:yes gene_type:complete